ncbi:rhomboid family intramembrane serine protease [Arachnia propionica]|nr:rhomboid family intramembrane serine protease [Arachnia propionica]
MTSSACYRHPGELTGISCQRCQRPICPRCMIPGAVGFQCPLCVQTGIRQTRQAELPYGGTRSRQPELTSWVLIGINLAVWLLILATGSSTSPLLHLLALQSDGMCVIDGRYVVDAAASQCAGVGGQWWTGVASGGWWQVLTSAFVHLHLVHLGFNMVALYFLGPQLERVLGRIRFLALYLISAVAGSALVMWLTEPHVTTLGASGAIFGMMAALLLLAWKLGGNYQQILLWIGINIAITVFGAGTISWQGHLGGFLGGLAVTAALVFLPKKLRRTWQWPLVGAVALLCLAAVVVRVLALS